MRVLRLVETGDPWRTTDGALSALSELGVEPIPVTLFGPDDAFLTRMKALGFPAYTLGCRRVEHFPRSVARFRSLIRRIRPDLVHCHQPSPGLVGGLGARSGGCKAVVFHRHYTVIVQRQRMMGVLASRLASITATVSDASARMARDEDRVPVDQICVALNGAPLPREVADEEVEDLRSSLGIPPGARVISCVARLRVEKGIDVGIKAVEETRLRGLDDVHLVIVGGGPQRAELETLASSMPRAAIHFVGPRPDVWPWFALSDAVIAPSFHDACPLSTIEAMAAGKPVIASNREGLLEVIEDGRTGLLVTAGDPGAFSEAIARVLGNPSYRAQLGDAALKRHRAHFTIEAMVRRWVRCYRAALSRAA